MSLRKLILSPLPLAMAAILFTFSCQEDPVKPSLTFTTNVGDANAGDTVVINVSANSDQGIKSLYIDGPTDPDGLQMVVDTTFAGTPASIALQYAFVVSPKFQPGETLTFEATVTDEDETETKSASITIGGTLMVEYADTGRVWDVDGEFKGAWDLVGDTAVSLGASENVKDVKDMTDNVSKYGFAAKFYSGNGAKFIVDNGFDYDNATKEMVAAKFASEAGADSTIALEANNVVLIKLNRPQSDFEYVAAKITEVVLIENRAEINEDHIFFKYKKK